jgi:hypothetical protein
MILPGPGDAGLMVSRALFFLPRWFSPLQGSPAGFSAPDLPLRHNQGYFLDNICGNGRITVVAVFLMTSSWFFLVELVQSFLFEKTAQGILFLL